MNAKIAAKLAAKAAKKKGDAAKPAEQKPEQAQQKPAAPPPTQPEKPAAAPSAASGGRKRIGALDFDTGEPSGTRPVATDIDPAYLQKVMLAQTEVKTSEANELGGRAIATVRRVAGEEAAGRASHWQRSWVKWVTDEVVNDAMTSLEQKGSWAQTYYAATQDHLEQNLVKLQAAGIADEHGYLTLYRGIGEQSGPLKAHPPGTEVGVGVRGLSSWTSDPAVAGAFAEPHAGTVLKQRVHYSRIFSAHSSNRGGNWNSEDEYVVTAPERNVAATIHSHETDDTL